jgi:Ser/Thr protein kinase RdoA (MazF antagonist)
MLGDAPLPADEAKELALVRSMHRLREYQRVGWLDIDRNTPSWREWRRRRRGRHAW